MKFVTYLNVALTCVNLYFFVTTGSILSLAVAGLCAYSVYLNRGILTSKGDTNGI